MATEIIFKTKGNKDIISFLDFKYEYDKILNRIIFRVIVDYEIFNAETIIEAEEYDFIDLQKNLSEMYHFNLNNCVFSPIDGHLVIKFHLLKTGNLEIEMKLWNVLFTGELSIEFMSDITFLPDIIKSINNVLLQKE